MSFAQQVATFAAKSEKAIDQTVRAITYALFAEVIDRTPVDTGRLKGNWQVSQGAPVGGTVEITDKDGGTTKTKVAVGMGGWGSVTYLTNNLPYAYRIEYDGWSHTKAPAGMVRVSFARIQQIVAREARKHKV